MGNTKKGIRCKAKSGKNSQYCFRHKEQEEKEEEEIIEEEVSSSPSPSQENGRVEEEIVCPCCQDVIRDKNKSVQLPCHVTHCLHLNCLQQLLNSDFNKCPLCRAKI